MKEYLCACNGLYCKGTCREEHLYNKNEALDGICSAAYTEKEERRAMYRKDNRDND